MTLVIFLILVQAIGVIALASVGLLPCTRSNGRLTKFGRILLITAAVIFLIITALIQIETEKKEARLYRTIVEIKERLFQKLAPEVMEASKEVSPVPRKEASEQIQIKEPQDGTQMPARTYIEGSVSDAKAKVWVIVHPMGVSAYWIQPAISVKKDGNWKAMIYLGRAGNIDVGKQFEIMAVANPMEKLREGDVLSSWPDAQWNSHVIQLTRGH